MLCTISHLVQIESDQLVIGILNTFHNNKKIKTISDTAELIEHAVYAAAVEENSVLLQTILRWNQSHKTKKFTHKGKTGAGGPTGVCHCLCMIVGMLKHYSHSRLDKIHQAIPDNISPDKLTLSHPKLHAHKYTEIICQPSRLILLMQPKISS